MVVVVLFCADLEDEVESKESHAGKDREHGCILHLYPVGRHIATFLEIKKKIESREGRGGEGRGEVR